MEEDFRKAIIDNLREKQKELIKVKNTRDKKLHKVVKIRLKKYLKKIKQKDKEMETRRVNKGKLEDQFRGPKC